MFSYIKKMSDWSYDTSSGVELGLSVGAAVGGARGSIVLTHPTIGKYTYEYLFAGVGVGVGWKTGILSKGGISYSKEAFKSSGEIYIPSRFPKDELNPEDMQGYTAVFEFSVMAGVGGSGYAMLLGVDIDKLVSSVPLAVAQKILTMDIPDTTDPTAVLMSLIEIGDIEAETMLNSGNAILIMRGVGAGLNVGASVMGQIGGLWLPYYKPEPINFLHDTEIPVNPRFSYAPVPISLPDDILFDTNSSDIKPTGLTELNKATTAIRLNPNRQILVTGNTDSTGSDSYNIGLSNRRAEAVKKWIVNNLNVKESNIITRGNGEAFPKASNNTSDGRQKNRRVEILIKD